MIQKILIKKARKTFLEDQQKEVVVSSQKMYFIEDISKDYHCSDGVFKKEDLKKKDTFIKSVSGQEFFIMDAYFIDTYKGIRKTAQTIPLKDLGFIIAELGIDKTMTVVDAGAGSGGCACMLARYAKKVYTYDIENKNIEQTKANISAFRLKNIVLKQQDIYEKIPNKNVDVIILDVPEPWRAVEHAFKALKYSGFLIVYCPQITQIQQLINSALKKDFIILKTVEIIERDWKVQGEIVRPISLSNIHSGFITVLRKVG